MPRPPSADSLPAPTPAASPSSQLGDAAGPDRPLDGPLAHLAEQLWEPALRAGRLRLSRRGPAPGWREIEHYLVVPSIARATILVPDLPSAALRGALLNYRGLRSGTTALQRSVLGGAVTARVRMPFPRLSVQVPDDASDDELPLGALERILGTGPLLASIGVRTGANRKATLQLVDADGVPRGFAKLGWDRASSTGIRAETVALHAGPHQGPVQVPRPLAAGTMDGRPYVVTAPLPLDVRAVRGPVAAPSADELAALCPRTRTAPLGQTGQLRALRERLAVLATHPAGGSTRRLVDLAVRLTDAVAAVPTEVPVARRWHGDLTPWNVARDGQGTLWCWDWESSEPDAVAWLDALHWHAGVRRERGERLDAATPAVVLEDARPWLRAAALPRCCDQAVAALWAATMAERALGLALTADPADRPAEAGDADPAERWEDAWVRPDELESLLRGARRLLAEAPRPTAR